MNNVRTRFSPSPTGLIHLGNARAALFSALFATKHQGTFILRIEDTDVTRSEEKYVTLLEEDLHWLSIDWQEGPGVDGSYGPYWESRRQPIYEIYYQQLENENHVYPCFCTDQELNVSRKMQLSKGQAPRYAGTCLKLTSDEIKAKIAAGVKHAWRFKVQKNVTISFNDLVKGPQQFLSNDLGDFIVRRADGTAPFLYCNAIDDAKMKITHVLRGEDHLANTPRQILLLQTLKLSVPAYGHLSLILGDDGQPLSKRHGSFSVKDMREHGYLPLAIINYLTRLGHQFDHQALLSFTELAPHFNIEKLSRSPARFDLSQLHYWQKIAVSALDGNEFWRWLGADISNQVPDAMKKSFVNAVKANVTFPKEASEWASILFHKNVTLAPQEMKIIQEAGEQFFVEAEEAVDRHGTQFPDILQDMHEALHLSGKKLFMPIRIALTGQKSGPELAQIAEILGQEKMKHRFSRAFKIASGKGE